MDKYEREPRLHLFVCFGLGIVCTLPAINMEMLGKRFINADPHNLFRSFIFATLVIGLVEEFLKFISLLLYAYPRREFNEPMDGIVYSTMVSMGFAAMENILYVQGDMEQGWTIALARAFTAVPAHGLFALAMGYYVGKAKFENNPVNKLKYALTGLGVAVLLHGFYDFLLLQEMYQLLMMMATLSVVVGWYHSDKFIKIHQDASPFRDDHHVEKTLNEIADLDRKLFIQNPEIMDMMLQRMHLIETVHDNWGEIYVDDTSGDKWLKFSVASNFTEDTSPRLVRMPGPGVNEVIQLTFNSEYLDEIFAAASFLSAKETFECQLFRTKLIKRLEEFDINELNDLHRERFRTLIEATNLAHYDPITKNNESPIIVEKATRLLNQLT
jgi:RsiW-degrading membrane proteinase PrsW (M82 family)